jgi:hypothetical protein
MSSAEMKPTFIGLGGQKCASSWLYAVFKDHPDVFVSNPKELNFFSSFFDRGHQWYESHFTAGAGRAAVGEISPSYLSDRDAPSRAREYNPNFRILLALRDPVERAYSNHLHNVRLGYWQGSDLSFEAGLACTSMYVEQSRYAKHLQAWLEYFQKDRVLIILQEEIATDPQAQARLVYEFLGIGRNHVSDIVGQRTNESYLPRSRGRERFIREVGAWTQRAGLGWVERGMRRLGVVSALHRGNRLDIRKIVPPMHDQTRRMLIGKLGPDTLALAKLMGRRSLPWKTWEIAAQAGTDE